MPFPSRASPGCRQEDLTPWSFQPSPRMEATLRDGHGPGAQRPSLPRRRLAVGEGAAAPPQHQDRLYLWITQQKQPCPLRESEATGEASPGDGPVSGSEWECGPARGRGSSPQASVTPWSGLLDPRAEDAGKLRGAGRENRCEGPEGAPRTLWASDSVAKTYCLHPQSPAGPGQVCTKPACAQGKALPHLPPPHTHGIEPLEGAGQGLRSPFVQGRRVPG